MRSEFDDGCPFINTIRHVKGIEGLNKKNVKNGALRALSQQLEMGFPWEKAKST